MQNGKGSKRRPLKVDPDEFNSNWDLIFKPKPTKKPKKSSVQEKETEVKE
jgi:hypothetical protein